MLNTNGISGTNDYKYSKPREKIKIQDNEAPTCVVLTYSVLPNIKDTLYSLYSRGASVHYTIEKVGKQVQHFNDLTDIAFFAGESSWGDKSSVNNFSIGTMLIHYVDETGKAPEENFPTLQIKKLIEFLRDVKTRYPNLDLKNNLVGLGEVAAKHIAPGKLFPWKTLAEHGFGQFIETTEAQRKKVKLSPGSEGEEVSILKKGLRNYGYDIEINDKWEHDDKSIGSTSRWVTKFNDRYVPGQPTELACVWTEASEYCLAEILKSRPVAAPQKSFLSSIAAFFCCGNSSNDDNSMPSASRNTPSSSN